MREPTGGILLFRIIISEPPTVPPTSRHPQAGFHLRLDPNSVNSIVPICFDLLKDTCLRLAVYDLSGRLVAGLINGCREAERHEVTFDGTNLASGTHIARLTAGDYSQVQKLVLMK